MKKLAKQLVDHVITNTLYGIHTFNSNSETFKGFNKRKWKRLYYTIKKDKRVKYLRLYCDTTETSFDLEIRTWK